MISSDYVENEEITLCSLMCFFHSWKWSMNSCSADRVRNAKISLWLLCSLKFKRNFEWGFHRPEKQLNLSESREK